MSRDLTRIASAASVAPALQMALENWDQCAPRLEQLSMMVNEGFIADAGAFDPSVLASPLPRAHQFLDGSAYLNHVELVRKARGAELPDDLRDDPLMYQAVSERLSRRLARTSWSPARTAASTSRPKSLWSSTMCRWGSAPTPPAATSSW